MSVFACENMSVGVSVQARVRARARACVRARVCVRVYGFCVHLFGVGMDPGLTC